MFVRAGRRPSIWPIESADAVIATAVLCSVEDQLKALQEIRRILKPGGQFVFMEHVAADRGTTLRRIQHSIQPLWSCLADGCHPARDTHDAIVQAGFEPISVERFRLPLGPIAPHIAGIAVRSSVNPPVMNRVSTMVFREVTFRTVVVD